jgi:hypothetical protein
MFCRLNPRQQGIAAGKSTGFRASRDLIEGGLIERDLIEGDSLKGSPLKETSLKNRKIQNAFPANGGVKTTPAHAVYAVSRKTKHERNLIQRSTPSQAIGKALMAAGRVLRGQPRFSTEQLTAAEAVVWLG